MTPSTPSGFTLLMETYGAKDRHGDAFGPDELTEYIVGAEREAVEAYRLDLAEKVRAQPDWTDERTPEDDAECDEVGCENRGHPVYHKGFSREWVLRLIEGEK